MKKLKNLIRELFNILNLKPKQPGLFINKQKANDFQISEKRFYDLLENVKLISVLLDEYGKVTYCNPYLLSLTGYTRDEIIGCDWFEKMVPEAHSKTKELFLTGLKTGKIIEHYEYPILTKSGKLLNIFWNNTILRSPSGAVTGTASIGEDITGRKQTEESLHDREELLSKIFKGSPMAISIADVSDGKLTEVNEVWCRLMGFSSEEAIGKNVEELGIIDAEQRSQLREEFLRKGYFSLVDSKITTKSREKKNILTTAELIKIKGRQFSINLVIDITERKKAEESLHNNERILRLFVEHSPAAIAMLDREMKYIIASRRYLIDYDLGEQNLVGRSHYEIFPEIPERWKEIHNRCLTGEIIKTDEDSFPRTNGKIDWLRWEIHPWYELQGEIGGIIIFSEVITDRKQSEEKLHELNEELEQRVVHRTEQLEAANKELEAFSYSVSHDLRAPLRAVNSYTKILLEEYDNKLDEEGKRLCGIISSSATQMGMLIDDLLNFSRIGRSNLNSVLINMNLLAGSILNELTHEQRNSRFNLNIGKLHNSFGDQNLIRIVWNNLVSNAIKYSSKEKISNITIGSKKDGKMIVYSIKDNGVGFEMDYVHKLFGVFQRLHSESEFEGNGVGLAIVQRIILNHGGRVWAEGEVGKGATFYFTLQGDGGEESG